VTGGLGKVKKLDPRLRRIELRWGSEVRVNAHRKCSYKKRPYQKNTGIDSARSHGCTVVSCAGCYAAHEPTQREKQLISRPLGRIDPWGLVVVNARDIEIDTEQQRTRVMNGGVLFKWK
jgi:hypothetical protein